MALAGALRFESLLPTQSTSPIYGRCAIAQLRTNRRNGSGRGSFDSALRRPGPR
jgi:hypothetical protein